MGENTRFIYGIGGAVIAEYDGSSGNFKKEYVADGGSMITTMEEIRWLQARTSVTLAGCEERSYR